jgi:hypothetical protein
LYSQLARDHSWVARNKGAKKMNAPPRRLLIPSLIGLFALVVVGALAIFSVPRTLQALYLDGPDIHEAKQVICPGPSPVPAYNGPDAPPLGAPAIVPRNDCTPSFTAQDVLGYENTHPFAAMRVEAVGKPKITKIWFITSAEASGQMHGESIGIPDDALVCHVELYGTFRTGSAPGGQPTERPGAASQVFDAHTGNLLVAGG